MAGVISKFVFKITPTSGHFSTWLPVSSTSVARSETILENYLSLLIIWRQSLTVTPIPGLFVHDTISSDNIEHIVGRFFWSLIDMQPVIACNHASRKRQGHVGLLVRWMFDNTACLIQYITPSIYYCFVSKLCVFIMLMLLVYGLQVI